MQFTNPITSHRDDYDAHTNTNTVERISPNRNIDDANSYRVSPNKQGNSYMNTINNYNNNHNFNNSSPYNNDGYSTGFNQRVTNQNNNLIGQNMSGYSKN